MFVPNETMHRLSRLDLQCLIHNIIVCSRLKRHRSGRPILHSLETSEGKAQLTELICDQIDNDSVMVIAAEGVGFGSSYRRGKWGIDEPVPAIVPVAPSPPSVSPKDP